MNRLLQHRYLIRDNLVLLVGLCLCMYFSYHALQGDRSVFRLMSLKASIATMSLQNDSLEREHVRLEEKVVMMRDGSINRDLLEEQARSVLGYRGPDEITILVN